MLAATPDALASFWARAREEIYDAPEEVPEAWVFGATPEHADALLELVLAGTKTGTASSLWDYEATGDPLPRVGDLSIILSGREAARAVIRTTALTVLPFDEVTEEHAHAEGEGDRTLAAWREIHERFWRDYSENERGFSPDMPVLCERFEVVYVSAIVATTNPPLSYGGEAPAGESRSSGRAQRTPSKREKSLSYDTTLARCSMASAAR